MPILLATSPLARDAIGADHDEVDLAARIRWPAMPSVTTVTGIPSRASSHAVRRAPWRNGRVSSASTEMRRPASAAARTTPSAVP